MRFFIGSCLGLALLAGCVTTATHEKAVTKASLLEESVAGLENEYQTLKDDFHSLQSDKTALELKLVDVLRRNSGLQQDILRARADLTRLETLYTSKNEEAGKAMVDMRQTIDALEEQNRTLSQAVEEERERRQKQISALKGTYDQLVGKLEEEIARGEVTISELEGRLTVNMVERIIFDSGESEIKTNGLRVLKQVGAILRNVEGKTIQVEGHTDNVPISARLKSQFPTNWELSVARATNVVRFLQDKAGVPGSKLSACGFGPYRPLASNRTAKGRAQNRRIQIILIPEEGVRSGR